MCWPLSSSLSIKSYGKCAAEIDFLHFENLCVQSYYLAAAHSEEVILCMKEKKQDYFF